MTIPIGEVFALQSKSDLLWLARLMKDTGLAPSTTEAVRLIRAGAVKAMVHSFTLKVGRKFVDVTLEEVK